MTFLRAAGGAVALLVIALAGGFLWLRGSLPQVDGTLRVAGLDERVTVTRDAHGIRGSSRPASTTPISPWGSSTRRIASGRWRCSGARAPAVCPRCSAPRLSEPIVSSAH